ncbi:MAG: site-specific integrase [Bdellovibrionales bacterium]|nr:site-specific integrase [Bdellovibrionales bacterium]
MSVTSYFDEKTNQTLFRVRCSKTSSQVKGVRVDRRIDGILTEREAHKVHAKLIVQVERALLEAESKGSLWSTLVDEWELAAKSNDIFIREITIGTVEDYISIIRDRTSDWMKLTVTEIDRARAWLVLDRTERETSIGRRKRLRTAIDAIYKWGILSGRIKGVNYSPTDGFQSLTKEEDKMPEILNLEQIRTLLSYAQTVDHPWYPIWAVALFTGMRSGELYALEWDQIDFENRLLYVHRNWTSKSGFGPTKGRYWRSVPIESDQILNLFKELKLKRGQEKFVFHHWESWTQGKQAVILRDFCLGSGIPSVRFHTLRACFATQLIRDKVAPAVVMKICGWKDLKTMQRYIRLSGIEVQGATEGLKLLPEKEAMGRIVKLFER